MEEGYDTEAEIDDLAIPIILREGLRNRKQTVDMSPKTLTQKDQGGRTLRERQKVDSPKPHFEKKMPSPAKCKKVNKRRSKVVVYKGRSKIKKNKSRCGEAIPLNLKEVVIKLPRVEEQFRVEFVNALAEHELRKVMAEEEEVLLDIEPEEQVQADEEHPTEVVQVHVLESAADLDLLLSSYYSSWKSD